MQTRALLFVLVILATVIAASVGAQSSFGDETTPPTETTGTTTDVAPAPPAGPVPDMRLGPFREKRTNARVALHEKKEQLCRSHKWAHFVHSAREIRVDRRRENLAMWRHRRDHARGLSSRCSPIELGRRIAAREYGWGPSQFVHLFNPSSSTAALWERESGWQPCRRYPSTTDCGYGPFPYGGGYACGLPQFVPCSKLIGYGRELGDVPIVEQIRKGYNYIRDRYGTPAAADYFQLTHNYY